MTRKVVDGVELFQVRVLPSYPGRLMRNNEFPDADVPLDDESRLFWGFHLSDDVFRLVTKISDGDPRTGKFYGGGGEPSEWKGWNISKEYVEVLPDDPEETSEPSEPGITISPAGVPEAIRCQYKFGKNNHCTGEADWVIHYTPPPCGHPEPRGDHQRYCIKHFDAKLVYLGNDQLNHECDECGANPSYRDRLISVEKL